MRSCQYLGHQVGENKVKPIEALVRDVEKFEIPKKKKDVRAFLELTGYYRRFIPNYATVATPLSNLTKDDRPDKVEWKKDEQQAFDELKRALMSKPVLQGPDFEREFFLQTDASNDGVGVVLSQKEEDGSDRPIAFFSKKLKTSERNSAAVERECLAIVKAIDHFQVYLTGVSFTVTTDHSCLQYLQSMKDSGGRLTRWALKLQPYRFRVKHRPGKENQNADALSRQAWKEPEGEDVTADFVPGGEGGSVMAHGTPRTKTPNRNTEH